MPTVGGSSPEPLSEAHRVWCANHPLETIQAGESLGLVPSRFIRHTAEVEQAVVEGDWASAQTLATSWIAQEANAIEQDPHPGMGSMLAWETDAPEDFRLACVEAVQRG